MRIYISGRITENDNYKIEFYRKTQELVQKGCEVINPAGLDAVMLGEFQWKEYMNICLELLNLADAIVMLDGWRESKGACIEYGYALASDKLILQEDWSESDLL